LKANDKKEIKKDDKKDAKKEVKKDAKKDDHPTVAKAISDTKKAQKLVEVPSKFE